MGIQFPGGNLPPGRLGTLPRGTGFGGVRGTGALATQVLVQFITQYHNEALQQVAADLKTLQQQAAQYRAQEQQSKQYLLSQEQKLTEAQAARVKIANFNKDVYNDLLAIQKQAAKEEADLGQVTARTRAERRKILDDLRAAGIINGRELDLLERQNRVTELRAVAERQYINAANNRLAVEKQITDQLNVQQQLQAFGARAGASFANIAVASVGATVTGFLLAQALYEPMNRALESLQKHLEELVDPANAAKEAVKGLADEVNSIASSENITQLEAAVKLIERLGYLRADPSQRAGDTALAEQSALYRKIAERVQLALDLEKARSGTVGEVRDKLREVIALQQAQQGQPNPFDPLVQASAVISNNWGALLAQQQQYDNAVNQMLPQLEEWERKQQAIEKATRDAADAAKAFNDAIASVAADAITAAFDGQISAMETERDAVISGIQAEEEATIARIRDTADKAIENLQASADARIARLETRIRAIGERGPSARTENLAEQVEKLTKAEAERRFNRQLDEIQEQKALLLLKQRLELTNEAIDLTRYEGKERLVAIDVLLERMQRQNAAQDRFNKLLDIQYQINQGVRRQQGETIQDFINRRAQYYRGLLEQATELKRQGPEDELKAEKERVQTTLELRDLETRRTELLRQRAHDAQLKRLQDELKASQEADRKKAASEQQALRNRIANIRADTQDRIKEINKARDADITATKTWFDFQIASQRRAYEEKIQNLKDQRDATVRWTDIANAAQYAEAVKGAKSIAELNAISGALAGANFSASYVSAQLQALGIRPGTPEYEITMRNFREMLSAYQSQLDYLSRAQWNGAGGQLNGRIQPPGTHAEGGIIPLKNSLNLGADIRIGERGDEGGLMTSKGIAVLNNEIMAQLKEMDNRRAMFNGATFNVTGSGDPYNDQYQMERMIERVVRKVLQ